MKRTLLNIAMGQLKAQEVVRVEGDDTPGPEDGNLGWRAFWNFIQSLQTNPNVIRHSVECPNEFVIRHNGRTWTVESKAIVDSPAGPAQTAP